MAGQGPDFVGAMRFWGKITAAADQAKGAAYAQTLVGEEAARLGVSTTFGTRTEVARLYGQAVALRNASIALSNAPAGNAITREYIAALPYGRGKSPYAIVREWHVRVSYAGIRNGQSVFEHVTLRYTGSLPPTVGALRDEAELVAGGLVEGYGTHFLGIGQIQIGEL